jgi:predicted unusual protein kinase regulating ubiquinone biosynthesis (AarF/ABC1/UbiB family)
MAEELDYNLEAANQRRFARTFRDDPLFAVPDVLVHSEHVIVSEWMGGTPLSQIVASGSQAERDAASERYMQFLLVGPARAGLLHADPHPGNFRLLPDGRLGVIDYGAVNRLPDGLPSEMGRLVSAAMSGEAHELEAGLRAEGFIKPSMQLDAEALLEYLQPFLEPLAHEEFTFSRPWLRSVAAHVNDVRRPEFLVGMKLNLPPSYLLIHRVWLGGIGVLCQLGGTVRARHVVVEHLPGMRLRHLPPATD